jgi:hypothetical protein
LTRCRGVSEESFRIREDSNVTGQTCGSGWIYLLVRRPTNEIEDRQTRI